MADIRFGPSTLGPVNESIENLKEYHKRGFRTCEIAFTYGVYIKDKEKAKEIGKVAKELGIKLSIHAPYYVNLNSKEKEKIESSKKRILDCCEIGHELGAEDIVFHAGFYSGMKPEEAYENIKREIIDLQKTIKEKGFQVNLCPEIMGKKNVFGSIDDISKLAKETGCHFCIDFAHTLARYNEHKFKELIKAFPQNKWHCHFSGIEYSEEKGERKHKQTEKEEWQNVLSHIKNLDKEISIVSEAPDPWSDAEVALSLYNN